MTRRNGRKPQKQRKTQGLLSTLRPQHECSRWRGIFGRDCPFAGLGDKDPLDLPEHKPPFQIFAPGKKKGDQSVKTPEFTNVISMEELRERVRQLTVRDADLGEAAITLLRERGPQAITIVLSLIALERASSQLGSKSSGVPSPGEATVEKRATGQLRQVQSGSGRGGRGGFLVNDAANLKRMLGFRKLRKGGESSDDPGFFFPGEPT